VHERAPGYIMKKKLQKEKLREKIDPKAWSRKIEWRKKE